jgi:hypothetical protein
MRFARCWFVLIIVAFFVLAGRAYGDVGPAFLSDEGNFPGRRFDNLADYPQFDFYVLYAHGRGNPFASPRLARVQSGQTLQLEGGGRIGGAQLLAVPHGERPPAVWDNSKDAWSKAPPGCLQSTYLDGVHLGEGYLVPYHVRIEGDKLEVTAQPTEWQPIGWTKVWLKRLPCIAVPLAFCAALGWLGARLARRLFPPKPASSGV